MGVTSELFEGLAVDCGRVNVLDSRPRLDVQRQNVAQMTFRKAWERYANGAATGWRGRFDTSLTPKIY